MRQVIWMTTSDLQSGCVVTLSVREKSSRPGVMMPPECLRCIAGLEIVQHGIVRCPGMSELIIYVEHVLSHLGRVRLSTESILKIVTLTGLSKEGKGCFRCTVAILKECM